MKLPWKFELLRILGVISRVLNCRLFLVLTPEQGVVRHFQIFTGISFYGHLLNFVLLCTLVETSFSAENQKDYIPELNEFPPPDTGAYIAGELVMVDSINRRGGLRLDGDFNDDRYDKASAHQFAMLPYGMIWYHGAPAELRDIPIGTHLHGRFYLPPEGNETIPPPEGPPQYVPKHNHAISLEDDFSFYQRRGQAWKILSVELRYGSSREHFLGLNQNGDWRKAPVAGKLKVVPTGHIVKEKLKNEQTFEVDRFTRIWKGNGIIEWEDIAPENAWTMKDNVRSVVLEAQVVQVGLTWAPEWKNRQFHVADLWFDKESRKLATKHQIRVHLRYQLHRGLAAVVEQVKHQGQGKGIVIITLFGGMNDELYDDFRVSSAVTLCAAEETLRTYWRNHDNKEGSIIDIKKTESPPLGSSGIQLHIQVEELLEGFRRGRFVRVDRTHWPRVKLPPEERVHHSPP